MLDTSSMVSADTPSKINIETRSWDSQDRGTEPSFSQ